MNKSTAKALEASIRHWERMRDGKRVMMKGFEGYLVREKPSSYNCHLCRLFIKEDCKECPIGNGCRHTPYYGAHRAFCRQGPGTKKFKAAAAKMVKFLESLREKPS